MGYSYNDTAVIDAAAREMGFVRSVEELDGKTPSFFQRYFSHRPEINRDRLNSVIFEMAEKGDAVFVGRGGQVLLKSFHCALHVRIIASEDARIKTLMARGYTEDVARKTIEHSDHERSSFIKFAFGVDWGNPTLYDMILSTDKVGEELAVDTIVSMARSNEIKACSVEALAILDRMALKNRAQAAIIEAGLSSGKLTTVFVDTPEQGIVQLTGVVKEQEVKEQAEQVLKNIRGIKSVDNRILVVPEFVGAV